MGESDGPEGAPVKIRTGLYRLFDDAGELLYVGIGTFPQHRISDHRRLKPWASEIRSTSVEWYDSRDEALAAEAVAIKTERPAHNIIASQVRRGGTETRCAPDMEPIWGVGEMAWVMGVTRQRVFRIIRSPEFPEPLYKQIACDFWRVADVQEWARRTGRTLHIH